MKEIYWIDIDHTTFFGFVIFILGWSGILGLMSMILYSFVIWGFPSSEELRMSAIFAIQALLPLLFRREEEE